MSDYWFLFGVWVLSTVACPIIEVVCEIPPRGSRISFALQAANGVLCYFLARSIPS